MVFNYLFFLKSGLNKNQNKTLKLSPKYTSFIIWSNICYIYLKLIEVIVYCLELLEKKFVYTYGRFVKVK